jgi:adenine/guanine phosphoribosyltransferase-like PRPP-binding protein
MHKLKTLFQAGATAVTLAVVSAPTYAAGLADMAAGVDKTDIIAGLTAIGLLIAAIAAGRMGIRKVIGMIK